MDPTLEILYLESRMTGYCLYHHLKDKGFHYYRLVDEWNGKEGVYQTSLSNLLYIQSSKNWEDCDRMLLAYLQKIVKPVKETGDYFTTFPNLVTKEELL